MSRASDTDAEPLVAELVSYAVGCVLGRWDVPSATGGKPHHPARPVRSPACLLSSALPPRGPRSSTRTSIARRHELGTSRTSSAGRRTSPRPRPQRRRGPEHRSVPGTRRLEGGEVLLGRPHGRQVRVVVHQQAITGKVHGPWSVVRDQERTWDRQRYHKTEYK